MAPTAGGSGPMTDHQTALVERHILDRAHRALERVVIRLETTAEVAGMLGATELAAMVQCLLDDLETALLPHMEWEEQVCFPETDRLAGTPWATQLLRLQHEQIRSHSTSSGPTASGRSSHINARSPSYGRTCMRSTPC